MTKTQRNQVLELTKKNYQMLGCEFNLEDRELVEYIWETNHPEEIRCLQSAINAHNLYNKDNISIDDFFEWHGL